MTTPRARFVRLTAAVLAAGLLVAACGDDDPSTVDTPAAGTSEEATTSTTPAGEAFTVTAVDYGYQGLPSEIDKGDKVVLTNSSTKEIHELVAFKLPAGETRSSADLVKLPQAELEGLFSSGPPTAVLIAPPGGAAQIAPVPGSDGTFSEAGRYLVLCNIGIGTNPQSFLDAAQSGSDGPPPADPDAGPPHFTAGMHGEIVVK